MWTWWSWTSRCRGVGGLEVVSRLQAERPGLPVLVLSMHPVEGAAVQAMEAGAVGYLTKRDAPDHIVGAIQRVAQGRRYLTAALAEALASRALGDRSGAALSVRELQVVRAVAEGLTRAETVERLGIAATTVSAYKGRAKGEARGDDRRGARSLRRRAWAHRVEETRLEIRRVVVRRRDESTSDGMTAVAATAWLGPSGFERRGTGPRPLTSALHPLLRRPFASRSWPPSRSSSSRLCRLRRI